MLQETVETVATEVPLTYSPQEAVGIIKESGVVGCGGAGFPTYVKYANPQPTLLVNAAESEPGYYADKLLLRDAPHALVGLFRYLRELFSMERFVIGAEDVAAPYMGDLEEMALDTGEFSIEYFAAKYKYGQERALAKVALGVEIPSDQLPHHKGLIVNNNETLLNLYRALMEDRPVTTKFIHVYGEALPCQVYEAPIGALATDVLRVHGTDLDAVAECHLYDGGPILADRVMERVGDGAPYAVRKNTNALLVVHPDKDRPRNKHYPHPDYEHNSIDCPWAPDRILNIEGDIRRVRVPRDVAFGDPARLCVQVGDAVEVGDEIGHPTQGLSVGIHASISGQVTAITEEYVEIQR